MNVRAVRTAPVQTPPRAERTLGQDVKEAALETGREWMEESSNISAGAGGFSLMMLGLYALLVLIVAVRGCFKKEKEAPKEEAP